MEEHKKQNLANDESYLCNFCGKMFYLQFALNRHIHKYHLHNNSNWYKCDICKNVVDKTKYNAHMKTHDKTGGQNGIILNLKLSKENGVWESKPKSDFNCSVCFKKFQSEKKLLEHTMKTHMQTDLQTQCEDCSMYVNVMELNNHMQQCHNKRLFKCLKCNLIFDNKQTFNRHSIHCSNRSSNTRKKFQNRPKNNVKSSFLCFFCGVGFNNSLSFKKHMVTCCKRFTCKYCHKTFITKDSWSKHMDDSKKLKRCVQSNMLNETFVSESHNQNIVENHSSLNVMKETSVCSNSAERFNSNHMNAVNRFESPVSYNLVPNSYNLNTVEGSGSEQIDLANVNKPIVQSSLQKLMLNNDSVNLRKVNRSNINSTEWTSGSNEIDLTIDDEQVVQTESHNFMSNSQSLDSKNANSLCSNAKNWSGSGHIDLTKDEPTIQTVLHNLKLNNRSISLNRVNSVCVNALEKSSSVKSNVASSNVPNLQNASYNSTLNDSSVNIEKDNGSGPNVLERNSSDHIGLTKNNKTDKTSGPKYLRVKNFSQSINNSSQMNAANSIGSISVPQYLTVRNFNPSVKKVMTLCTNSTEMSSSVQTELTNIIGLTKQTDAPHNLNLNIKKEKVYSSDITERNSVDCLSASNCNVSTVQTSAPLDSMIYNNFNPNIKREKTSYSVVPEKNNSDHLDAANSNESTVQSTAPHNLMVNNFGLNIKKEISCSDVEDINNSENVDDVNSYVSIVQTDPSNTLIVKQELECFDDNLTPDIEREIQFSNRESRDVQILSSIATSLNREQSRKSIKFICTICNKPFTNLHSFALHMSSHRECSMHECVVCDATFASVLLWKNHMTYHQQQVDLNLSESQIVSERIESNLLDTNNLVSIKPKHRTTTLRNRKSEVSSLVNNVNSNMDLTRKSVRKYKKQFNCNKCDNVFPSKLTLTAHQTLHKELQTFSCKYCQKPFSGQGPLTNHEKSHCHPDKKLLLHNIIEPELEPTEPRLDIQIENSYINSSYSCRYCERTFFGQGPLTNHEKSHRFSDKNMLLHNTEDMELEPVETKYNIEIEPDIDLFSVESEESKKEINLSKKTTSYSCNICKRTFGKKCHWANHMKLGHKMDLKSLEYLSEFSNLDIEVGNIDDETSVNNFITIKSINENNENPSVSTDLINSISESFYDKSLICTICDKQFKHVGALTNHKKMHSDYKPYKCQYCNGTFKMKGAFSLHVRSHRFKKAIRQNIKRENLMNLETEFIEEPQQIINPEDSEIANIALNDNANATNASKKQRLWFVCDVCDKKFSTPFQLIIHRKYHFGVVPYVCKICNSSYVLRHRWNRHIKCHYLKKKFIKYSKVNEKTNNPEVGTSKLKIHSVQRENQFKCAYCQKEYYLESQWKRHLTMSEECGRYWKLNHSELSSTQVQVNSKSLRFECNICKKTYSTGYNLRAHQSNVHKHLKIGNVNNNANTDEVNMELTTIEAFSQKPIILKQKKKQQISNNLEENFEITTEANVRKSTKTQNRKRKITYDISNQCKLCGKCYSSKANLSRHNYISHTKNNSITCKDCGRTFKHKYSFREHLRFKQRGLNKNDCSDARKYRLKLQSNNNRRHIVQTNKTNNRINVVQYVCQVCEMKFADKNALQKHEKTHIVSKYKCNDCGQQFETNVILGQHILEKHSVSITVNQNEQTTENVITQNTSSRPSNDISVQCKICFKVLKTSSYLSNHMRLHSGVKPFKCDKCNMAFRFKPNLRIHKRKHYLESKTL